MSLGVLDHRGTLQERYIRFYELGADGIVPLRPLIISMTDNIPPVLEASHKATERAIEVSTRQTLKLRLTQEWKSSYSKSMNVTHYLQDTYPQPFNILFWTSLGHLLGYTLRNRNQVHGSKILFALIRLEVDQVGTARWPIYSKFLKNAVLRLWVTSVRVVGQDVEEFGTHSPIRNYQYRARPDRTSK